ARIEPSSPLPAAKHALVLMQLGRLDEADEAARRAEVLLAHQANRDPGVEATLRRIRTAIHIQRKFGRAGATAPGGELTPGSRPVREATPGSGDRTNDSADQGTIPCALSIARTRSIGIVSAVFPWYRTGVARRSEL